MFLFLPKYLVNVDRCIKQHFAELPVAQHASKASNQHLHNEDKFFPLETKLRHVIGSAQGFLVWFSSILAKLLSLGQQHTSKAAQSGSAAY
jgi:hypothetical protein